MFLRLLIGLAVYIVGALISGSLAQSQAQPETQDMDDPTAKEGVEVMVVFGDIRVTAPNILYFGGKDRLEQDIDV